jgi:hypothetical protein
MLASFSSLVLFFFLFQDGSGTGGGTGGGNKDGTGPKRSISAESVISNPFGDCLFSAEGCDPNSHPDLPVDVQVFMTGRAAPKSTIVMDCAGRQYRMARANKDGRFSFWLWRETTRGCRLRAQR